MIKNNQEFWVTNISKMNVSISDLNLTIKSLSSVNLMDNRHYPYTLKQLINSSTSGSLYKKRDKLFVCQSSRNLINNFNNDRFMQIDQNSYIPTRQRSLLEIKNEKYEELQLSEEESRLNDERIASENADMEIDEQLSKLRK